MQKLNLPEYKFRFRVRDNKTEIFDEIRKKYLVLNPEEWVRQNLIKYFINVKNIPLGLISIEKTLKVNKLHKRTDIVVYDKKGKAVMIVECKAPSVKIGQKVFEQAALYNMGLKVPFLMVSNGQTHFCCEIDHEKKQYSFLNDIPNFETLCGFY
jgi:type I site-specific restriction endonuclease